MLGKKEKYSLRIDNEPNEQADDTRKNSKDDSEISNNTDNTNAESSETAEKTKHDFIGLSGNEAEILRLFIATAIVVGIIGIWYYFFQSMARVLSGQ